MLDIRDVSHLQSFSKCSSITPVAGVGLDMALSKGLELVQREDFEREVRRAVVATKEEYVRVLEAGYSSWRNQVLTRYIH